MAAEIITADQVMKNKILKLGFTCRLYAPYLDEFTEAVNMGAQLDPFEVMREMVIIYEKFGGISMGIRTVALDFAWAVMDENPQYWTDEERQNGYSDFPSHLDRIHPELDSKTHNHDVATMEYGEYFIAGMDFCFLWPLEERLRPHFCHAMFRFFNRWSFQMDKEQVALAKDELRERMANDR